MTSYVTPKKNAEFIFYLGLPSTGTTGEFQSNPTLAAGDVKVSTDGGALGNITALPTVTPASGKMVKVTLSAAEMNGDNVTVVFSDAAGGEWDDVIVNIQTSARQIDDLSTQTSVDALPTAAEIRTEIDSNSTQLAAILTDTGTTIPDTLTTIDTVVDAIQAKTDSLTFTVAGNLDANIQYVNDVAVTGTGASGDEWGPA